MSNSIYIVYRTTNLVNNKEYIGVHRQKRHYPILFEGYLGSGKHLLRAIKKYGKQNFIRETLHVYDNPKEAYQKEKELVDELFVLSKKTYNLSGGGMGTSYHSEETKRKIGKANKGKISPLRGRTLSEEHKQRLSDIGKTKTGSLNNFYGRNHREDTIIMNSLRTQERWRDPEKRSKLMESFKYRPPCSEETRQKISETSKRMWSDSPERMYSLENWQKENGGAFSGHNHSDETKRNLSEKNIGDKNPMYGKSHSEEVKKKISLARKGKKMGKSELVICPHCGKEGYARGIKPRHFDKCKYKYLNIN